MHITFFGVRGSTPSPAGTNQRYGGNTSTVVVRVRPDVDPIILDLGTGLRGFGRTQPLDGSFRGTALLTHLHWDHVQGLPFFAPIDRVGARLDVYGPPDPKGSLAEVFEQFMSPPWFPLALSELRGRIDFHEVVDEEFDVGPARVTARRVPHTGPTLGYRIDCDGASVAYIPDHQAPVTLDSVAPAVLALCHGVDVLIHDAQYTPAEFRERAHWGHCTMDYALLVGRLSKASRVCLFHHDPDRSDDALEQFHTELRDAAAGRGDAEVLCAYEGMTLEL